MTGIVNSVVPRQGLGVLEPGRPSNANRVRPPVAVGPGQMGIASGTPGRAGIQPGGAPATQQQPRVVADPVAEEQTKPMTVPTGGKPPAPMGAPTPNPDGTSNSGVIGAAMNRGAAVQTPVDNRVPRADAGHPAAPQAPAAPQSQADALAARDANLQAWQTDHDAQANNPNPNYWGSTTADLNSGDYAGKTDQQLIQMYSLLGSSDPRKAPLANALDQKYGADFASGAMINRYNAGGAGVTDGQQYMADSTMAYQWANNSGAGAGGGGGQPPGGGGGVPPGPQPPVTGPGGGQQPGVQPNPNMSGAPGNGIGVTGGLGLDTPSTQDYGPQTQDVQANQTVQGQLGDILKTGNPLLEGAKARAVQAANARGLGNSSMASQAGEEAMVNAAMPIAQQDAATYQKQALANQDITNQFLSMKEGAVLDLAKAYEAFKQSNYMFDKDAALKRYINDSSNSTQEKVAAMQAAASKASTEASLKNAQLAADTQLKTTGLDNASREAVSKNGLDAVAAQNLLQLKSNNFTHYVDSVQQIQLSQMEPDAKATQLKNLNAQYAGAPMPDGFKFNLDVFPTSTTTTDNGGGGQ